MSMDLFDTLVDVNEFFSKCKSMIENENRFFSDDRFIQALNELTKCKSFECEIDISMKLYRGRIYKDELDKTKTTKRPEFKGYDESGCGVNTEDWPRNGRMNPEGIRVLYLATSESTCAKEIAAASGDVVSIGIAHPVRKLRIADFPSCESRIRNKKKKQFVKLLNECLSRGYDSKDYIFTQYISMYCKSKNFDGIKYRSKYANKDCKKHGMNIAVFDYENCKFIESYTKKVKQISLEFYK